MVKKKEEIVDVIEEIKGDLLDPRQDAWDAFLAKYEKENPVKFAIKKARGEFDTIPAKFK